MRAVMNTRKEVYGFPPLALPSSGVTVGSRCGYPLSLANPQAPAFDFVATITISRVGLSCKGRHFRIGSLFSAVLPEGPICADFHLVFPF